jgi:hypothetical protein
MTMPNDKSPDNPDLGSPAANTIDAQAKAELAQQIRQSNDELDRFYTAIQINKAVFPRPRTFKH